MNHNDHYDSLLGDPARIASYSLRDPREYRSKREGGYANGVPTGRFAYDPEHDAAKCTIPVGSGEIGGDDYLILPVPPVSMAAGGSGYSVQWECRWGSSFLGARGFGLKAHKAFKVLYDMPGDDRLFEVQALYATSEDPTGVVCLPAIHTYHLPNRGGDGTANPLQLDGNEHPAASEKFYVRPAVWVRFTLIAYWSGGRQYVTFYAADEATDPVCLIDRMLATNDALPETIGISRFMINFDTSQDPSNPEPLELWFRNVVVFKDSLLPLGGRPIAGSGEPIEDPTDPMPEPEAPEEPPLNEDAIRRIVREELTEVLPVLVAGMVTEDRLLGAIESLRMYIQEG